MRECSGFSFLEAIAFEVPEVKEGISILLPLRLIVVLSSPSEIASRVNWNKTSPPPCRILVDLTLISTLLLSEN